MYFLSLVNTLASIEARVMKLGNIHALQVLGRAERQWPNLQGCNGQICILLVLMLISWQIVKPGSLDDKG